MLIVLVPCPVNGNEGVTDHIMVAPGQFMVVYVVGRSHDKAEGPFMGGGVGRL